MPNGRKSHMGGDQHSEKSDEKDNKNPKKGENSAKDKMSKINKEVSKDKREQFKDEVVKKKKKRRRRPKKKESLKQSEPSKQVEPEEIPPKAPVEPINPFEQEIPADVVEEPPVEEAPKDEKDFSKLPTNQYEQEVRAEEGELKNNSAQEEEEVVEEPVVDEEQAPINPFEAAEPPVSTIEKKALDDKPLDRKGVELEKEGKYEKVESKSAEALGQSAEQLNSTAGQGVEERLGEQGVSEENEAADEAEKAKVVEAPVEVAEVVNPKTEPIGGNIEPEEVSQAEEFQEDIWDILEQAGITKSRIIKIVVVLGAIILFIMFGGLGLFGIGGDDSGSVEVVEKDGGEVSENDDILPSVSGEGDISGVISSYVFGLEHTVAQNPIVAVPIGAAGSLAGVTAGLAFGEVESDFEARQVYYVDLLRRMDNIYSTDIYSLIDLSVDRRAALEKHINDMADIISEGDAVYFEIKSRLEKFDAEFETLAIERDTSEEEFFIATEELFPRSSYENLQTFIKFSKQATEIKAYYNAYKIVVDILIAYLDLLEPRYNDIVANKEALIKGIRVFDVPASDIDAILPYGEE